MTRMALEGLTIADFGWVWAAPHLGRLLADMGARVIKIESRARMDSTRSLPPFPNDLPRGPNRSGYYGWLNRNKLGVTLNLKTQKGVELAKAIIQISDAMMENYSIDVMKKFGLDYESVREVKPDIVYVSLTPLGTQGPFKDYVMYGRPQVFMSGLAHITGYPDREPSSMRVSWGDPVAGNHGAFAMLSALYHRKKTGQGQYIELSQWEGLISLIPEAVMDYTLNKRVRARRANQDDSMVPHNSYACRGGLKWVTIAVADDKEWDALCRVMGNPEWSKADRFADAFGRWRNQAELDRLIEGWTLNYTPKQVTNMLQQAGVAAFPSLSNRGLVEDPHLNHRGFFEEWDHPEMGKRKYDAVLWKMSKTPGKINRHAPLVGEHNNYVFGELLGLSQDEIDRLIKEKVIY